MEVVLALVLSSGCIFDCSSLFSVPKRKQSAENHICSFKKLFCRLNLAFLYTSENGKEQLKKPPSTKRLNSSLIVRKRGVRPPGSNYTRTQARGFCNISLRSLRSSLWKQEKVCSALLCLICTHIVCRAIWD